MLRVENVNGDITDCTAGVLINGVNCQSKMGSGVALAYMKKWPKVKEQYLQSLQILGNCGLVCIEHDRLYVANCFTQEFYGYDGNRYANVEAIEEALETAYIFAQDKGLSIKTPLLASDRGGLDWETEVLPIFERLAEKFEVQTFVFRLHLR